MVSHKITRQRIVELGRYGRTQLIIHTLATMAATGDHIIIDEDTPIRPADLQNFYSKLKPKEKEPALDIYQSRGERKAAMNKSRAKKRFRL